MRIRDYEQEMRENPQWGTDQKGRRRQKNVDHFEVEEKIIFTNEFSRDWSLV